MTDTLPAFATTSNPDYSNFIALSRYARWLPDKGRRETWDETVQRYVDFWVDKGLAGPKLAKQLFQSIHDLEVMPSMRCMMVAGLALDRDNVAGYNCAYTVVDSPRTFDETMYILMCGTGVGYSVEQKYINKLPEVAEQLYPTDTTIVVRDSKKGWSKAYRELITLLFAGQIPQWDVSGVRPAGARLKTFGGRASGPEPLVTLFRQTIAIFQNAAGRKLNSLECHDLMCYIADAIVVGGVRRSAMISLSDLSDDRMRHAKMGNWYDSDKQRRLANNSVAYSCRPDFDSFIREWTALYESKSGERGFFNREAAQSLLPHRRADAHSYNDGDTRGYLFPDYGTNPCSEIVLRPHQFCNLSEVVVRPEDTKETLLAKIENAVTLGTFQSTLTHFPYLRKVWSDNTAEERLLGVSLTGIMDHPLMSGMTQNDVELSDLLEDLKAHAIAVNAKLAKKLGINQSVAITCVKPSGTVSQLVDSASGIHARHAPFYIRRVRIDVKDPICQFMVDAGYPHEIDVMNDQNMVFSFPMAAPEGSVIENQMSAIEQLEHWKKYALWYCEHKPSVTVYYKPEEFLAVGQWVWDNFDVCSGISFLPKDDHIYPQAPYEEITEESYAQMSSEMPEGVDWTKLGEYEHDDNTAGSQTMACSGASCELVDLT